MRPAFSWALPILVRLALAPLILNCSSMLGQQAATAAQCIDCHSKITPNIVSDWKLSKHSGVDVTCVACHGDQHTSASDVAKVKIPTPETCAECHQTQVEQFKKGKHAMAWAAMKAMPTIHWQPMAMTRARKAAAAATRSATRSPAELRMCGAGTGFGAASCDACHTRHTFSVEEAASRRHARPATWASTIPQWEMYSSSKHGVRSDLKQTHILPADAAAPTCQTCHMQDGNHEVRTAWGFLAVRLPCQKTNSGPPTALRSCRRWECWTRMASRPRWSTTVKAADVARLTQEDWQRERDKMIKTCNQCHSVNFAKQQLEQGDDMIRNADHLMAEAIHIVAGLYKDGVLPKPRTIPIRSRIC